MVALTPLLCQHMPIFLIYTYTCIGLGVCRIQFCINPSNEILIFSLHFEFKAKTVLKMKLIIVLAVVVLFVALPSTHAELGRYFEIDIVSIWT